MRLIVTRPEPEAGRWVAQFGQRGIDAVALPLIEVRAVADTAVLAAAWQRLHTFNVAMFVSANAVRCFFQAADPVRRRAWTGGTLAVRAWATGPGTAQALAALGLPDGLIDQPPADAEQFDSEALWQRVAAQVRPGQRVLIVRGGGPDGESSGRDWLVSRLEEAGAVAGTVVAYQRHAPAWSAAQREMARQGAAAGAVWLFSSSEAVRNLGQLMPGQHWGAARALATHGRIAQAAREAGFGGVWSSRPTLEALTAALESIG